MMGFLNFLVVAALFALAIEINADEARLLTPKEGCGISKVPITRIVGGSPAKTGTYPWIVALGYKNEKETRLGCGGSLITNRHVLTAAHCMNSFLSFVRLAELDTRIDDPEQVDIPVSRFESHEEYDALINDIAMVYLKEAVKFTDLIRPICLPIDVSAPIRSPSYVLDRNPSIAGWGFTAEQGKMSPVLMHLQVPTVSNSDCRNMYKKIGDEATEIQFSERVMCAGIHAGKSTCSGDSGGPLMLPVPENGLYAFFLIGLVSYAEGCARNNVPTVYTRISYHIDWIQKKVQQ